MASVIVFGPTGQIGSVTARTAAKNGAKVWLAMRDTNKPVPGLSKDLEDADIFHRVQADLEEPETVSQAVKTSGAKRAFVYLAHGASDHMKAAFEALKFSGIEFVVFLSSFTINTDKGLRDIPATELIPYIHAQAEAHLDDIFGSDHYVAMRPGAFVTNLLHEREGIAAGQVSLLHGGEFQQDNIVPSDIGRASGNILVSGPRNGQRKVYLYGPEILSLHDSIVRIGRILDRGVKVRALSDEEAWNHYISSGLPEPYAKYMMQVLSTKGPDKGFGERFPKYDEGVSNVELYTGRPSTSLDDWVREHKAKFSA